MHDYPRLLGDIGGTNARFAIIRRRGGQLEELRTLSGADYSGPREAIEAYLEVVGGERPRVGAFGIANPIEGDRINMTNHTWDFSIDELRRQLGWSHALFVNDFTALALSLPFLPAEELRQLGGEQRDARRAIAVLGPGTGLGVSGLLPAPDGSFLPIEGEGGHVTLAAVTAEEAAVIDKASEIFPHVSAERLISGPGLVTLHESLAAIRRLPSPCLDAPGIVAGALEGADTLAFDSLTMFCAMLGTVAGNLALTLGAKGGVFIGGGIVPRLGEFFARSPFRCRFEKKGRFQAYMASIPVFVIHSPYPAFTGVAVALESALRA